MGYKAATQLLWCGTPADNLNPLVLCLNKTALCFITHSLYIMLMLSASPLIHWEKLQTAPDIDKEGVIWGDCSLEESSTGGQPWTPPSTEAQLFCKLSKI
ncbi:hypothetical protein E2C01_036758 [Portunus trituberculatus]|uniref:Uncharacterized protein n=1 Tax=Portunus trituberculatus TaxID=210409 RepID=A0A5B7F9J8_PORTR|nr:hypothetical protein [Portunus trituberculatus]